MWPMLTAIAVMKYFLELYKKGHTRQNRQGIQATKKTVEDQDTHMTNAPQN